MVGKTGGERPGFERTPGEFARTGERPRQIRSIRIADQSHNRLPVRQEASRVLAEKKHVAGQRAVNPDFSPDPRDYGGRDSESDAKLPNRADQSDSSHLGGSFPVVRKQFIGRSTLS